MFYLRLFPFRAWILTPKSNRKSTNQQQTVITHIQTLENNNDNTCMETMFFWDTCVFFLIWHLLRVQITRLSASVFFGVSVCFLCVIWYLLRFLANHWYICVVLVSYLRLFPFKVWILTPKSKRQSAINNKKHTYKFIRKTIITCKQLRPI